MSPSNGSLDDHGDPGSERLPRALRETSHRPWPVPNARWSVAMVWHDLLFAHWPVDANALRATVPSGLELETFDGHAWIGVVPFRMSRVGPRLLNRVPYVSAFPELNVRTYVRSADRPGVWFYSLDAARLLAVAAARTFFHLPYFWARMRLREEETGIEYSSRRHHPGARAAEFRARYRPTGPVELASPGSFDHWLTERYCLYARSRRGRLFRGEIHHVPWPLQPAEAEIETNSMVPPFATGEAPVDGSERPILHFARKLEVVSWSLEPA